MTNKADSFFGHFSLFNKKLTCNIVCSIFYYGNPVGKLELE